jgi:hypothetical protein
LALELALPLPTASSTSSHQPAGTYNHRNEGLDLLERVAPAASMS